ncbi:MAG: hypothetical protein J2P54_15025 [Bradyrhizobiaceae bacterium]|nr:hypothetical protein [Bradyrhizobiaceae bacterium]
MEYYRQSVSVVAGFVFTLIAIVWAAPTAAATVDPLIAERFASFSLPTPTPTSVIVCHGFGCRFRTPIALSVADDAKLSRFLNVGHTSAEAERKAVAQAVAWFQRRVAPAAGTASAKAYAAGPLDAKPSQFDCIDASTNTTTALLVLSELGLLKFHRLVAPVSRSPFLGHGVIHTTAVLVELQDGREWAIDSWVRNSGEPPDVLPLKTWYAGN